MGNSDKPRDDRGLVHVSEILPEVLRRIRERAEKFYAANPLYDPETGTWRRADDGPATDRSRRED